MKRFLEWIKAWCRRAHIMRHEASVNDVDFITVAVKFDWTVGFRRLTADIHQNAVDHGFWAGERPIGTSLCLIHSEISEALEADRHGDQALFAEELADAVIRIMDLCEAHRIDLLAEIKRKHQINKGRPYRHGKKY